MWLLLSLPLIGIKLAVLLGVGFYSAADFFSDTVVILAFCGVLILTVRWHLLKGITWVVAWLLYIATLLVTFGEALSFYFQGSSFNSRFFSNIQIDSLRSGLAAYPVVLVGALAIMLGILCLTAWLLANQPKLHVHEAHLHDGAKAAILIALILVATVLPSSTKRLLVFAFDYGDQDKLASTSAGKEIAAQLVWDSPSSSAIRATSGKNLVIIYMESLERIYTDDDIFPNLTPNLNRYRARGLDFAGYLTFPGADFTIGGMFASQCGLPYFPSPWSAFDLDANDSSEASFHPEIACLGDILHAATYKNVFMNPAALSFGGDGEFYRSHAYDEVLGLDELERASGGRLAHAGWGLYDSDLLRLATQKFTRLAASGKPFNLDVLTIDNHPPHGRPSPGCPAYPANNNSTLQAVHCTDYLVGRFLDVISRNPAWSNTIIAVMSDHQSLPNDAWPLYPESYQRRPLLFVLNAGSGVRRQRFYHMDIAPTLLHLMGVQTNARFVAGADRSESNAPDSPLVNAPTDVAVLRKAEWARSVPTTICSDDYLLRQLDNGDYDIGGKTIRMRWFGQPIDALPDTQVWAFVIGASDVRASLVARSELNQVLGTDTVTSILTIRSLPASATGGDLFTADWIGRKGALTHIADLPRLRGLAIKSPDCKSLIEKADRGSDGTRLDLSKHFRVTSDPIYPPLSSIPVDLGVASPQAAAYKLDLGWLDTSIAGESAALGLQLPKDSCAAPTVARFVVQPVLYPWRSRMDVRVLVNGHQKAIWHFAGKSTGTDYLAQAPLLSGNGVCDALIKFAILPSEEASVPDPDKEDPRGYRLKVTRMIVAAADSNSSRPNLQLAPMLNAPLTAAQVAVSLSLRGNPAPAGDGKSLVIAVDLVNHGTATLSSFGTHRVNLGAHLLDANGKNIDNDFARAELMEPLHSGEQETISIKLPLGNLAGHSVALLPVQEGVAWFDHWGVKPLKVGPFIACAGTAAKLCDKNDKPVVFLPATAASVAQ